MKGLTSRHHCSLSPPTPEHQSGNWTGGKDTEGMRVCVYVCVCVRVCVCVCVCHFSDVILNTMPCKLCMFPYTNEALKQLKVLQMKL